MKKTKYDENVLDWKELKNIGITRDTLQKNGELEKLLDGKETNPMTVYVPILGRPKEIEVTLQVQEENGTILLQLSCIKNNVPVFD